jgi:hypothetical protein
MAVLPCGWCGTRMELTWVPGKWDRVVCMPCSDDYVEDCERRSRHYAALLAKTQAEAA